MVQHCLVITVSEMTYTVSSGTLNPTIPYHCLVINTIHEDEHYRADT